MQVDQAVQNHSQDTTRINDQNPEHSLPQFMSMLNDSKIDHVIIHARKAILGGLSPKQNRETPPLNYDLVHHMKNKLRNRDCFKWRIKNNRSMSGRTRFA